MEKQGSGTSNWRDMFEQGRSGARGIGAPQQPPHMPPPSQSSLSHGELNGHASAPYDYDGAPALDLSVYKPWVLQRGRGRPSMLLELRRYEPKSGLWIGWQIAYPHLIAVEYIGDKMLSLDFGTRQFMIEGQGLDQLARHLQQGTVQTVVEYAREVWRERDAGPIITKIVRVMPQG